MTITTVNQLAQAIDNAPWTHVTKASRINLVAGLAGSMWSSTGNPAAGGFPASVPEACSDTTTGAIPITQQASPRESYIAAIDQGSNVGNHYQTIELHDRLVHTQNLSATIATLQTVSLDLNSFLASNNIDERKGDSNFSDIQWWLENRVVAGGNATTGLINVTYNDGSTGNLNTLALTSMNAIGVMFSLQDLIPAADTGKYIRGINNITLTTPKATGSFGFVATRYRCSTLQTIQNQRIQDGWDRLTLPKIYRNSCLTVQTHMTGSTTGDLTMRLKIIGG